MRIPLAIAVLLCCAAPSRAQEAPPPPAEDAFLERLAGTWEGEGTLRGAERHELLACEWTLGHQFLRVVTIGTAVARDGTTFEAEALLRPLGGGRYRGHVFDSQGDAASVEGSLDGEALVLAREAPGSGAARARVAYVLRGERELVARYHERAADGTYAQVGEVTFVRVD